MTERITNIKPTEFNLGVVNEQEKLRRHEGVKNFLKLLRLRAIQQLYVGIFNPFASKGEETGIEAEYNEKDNSMEIDVNL